MRIGFTIREALRALRRNAAPSFAAMVTVLVTVLVLGVFIPVVQAATGAANEVRDKLIVNVFLKTNADSAQIARVKGQIEGLPKVRSVEFVSKSAALAKQRKENPEAFELLGSNPLPDAFRIVPTSPDDVGAIRDALTPATPSGERKPIDAAIGQVSFREEDSNKILTITGFIKVAVALLAALLVLASVLLISNTIRLSLYARRREVEVMKLVGATDWFIRWPFVIEGMLVGAFGGILAIALLGVGKVALLDPLTSSWALVAGPQTMSFVALGALLLAASVGVSALGSGLSLRRFLRV